MKVLHSWLQEYMGTGTPSVNEIERILTFSAFEIDEVVPVGVSDAVIDVKILPNRSSDCLCHRGIARELATLTGMPLFNDPFTKELHMPETNQLAITIEDTHACRHFDLALVTGVTVAPSPKWLVERLEALGQRSINNVVDATNYVMFALGQPLHAYDADKFKKNSAGQWHFGTRLARDGESIDTLGGASYELDSSIQVIVNMADDSLAGIAGIKGGQYAVVDETTKNIILEAGNFDPVITRKASQKLRLTTDASKRFENNVASAIVPYALTDVVTLITEIAGGTVEGFAHSQPTVIKNAAVLITKRKAEAVLGVSLQLDTMEGIFKGLGFSYEPASHDAFMVTAPFERTDIAIEEDVIEEIGRIIGYDKVQPVVPTAVPLADFNIRHYYSEQVRTCLLALGFSEVITSSFRARDEIQLRNALASDKSYLRSSLVPNITEALTKNSQFTDLLGTPDIRIFEIGTVFSRSAKGVVEEHTSLAFGVRTKVSGYTPKDDVRVQEAVRAVALCLNVPSLQETIVHGVAEIHFTNVFSSLPTPAHYEVVPTPPATMYKPFSVYPSMSRDIAFFVKSATNVQEITALLLATAGPLCVRVSLFDEFAKDGKVSYAFRLVFQANDRTLTDEEILPVMEDIYKVVEARGWEVR
jgi:phenylalanyl-tRNA synthetase beta chain